jgi:hypothetical protein
MPTKYEKNEAGLFVCPTCGATKEKQNTMFYHIKAHANVLPFQCKLCPKTFLQAQTLANHIAAKHSKGGQAVACPCCPYKACQKANVIRHFLRAHCSEELSKLADTESTSGTWTCRACERPFQSNPAFTYHAAGCIRLADPALQERLDLLKNPMPPQA